MRTLGPDEADGMHEIPLPLPAGARNYMTSEGALRMADELRRLSEVDRPRASGALAAAESAEKAEHIRKLSEIERRISLPRQDEIPAPSSRGARKHRTRCLRTHCACTRGGRPSSERPNLSRWTPKLANPYIASWASTKAIPIEAISAGASPIAKALIGKRKGELAIARLPLEECHLRILEISCV